MSAIKKGKTLGKWGSPKSPDEMYLFGTPAEIQNRVQTGYDNPPEMNVPAFKQIPPANSGGQSLNNAGRLLRAGNLKFSKGPR